MDNIEPSSDCNRERLQSKTYSAGAGPDGCSCAAFPYHQLIGQLSSGQVLTERKEVMNLHAPLVGSFKPD